jgi:A/G-specific adenine glycosylase
MNEIKADHEGIIPVSLTDEEIKWLRKNLIQWGRKHNRKFPWRLQHSPFHSLVAEILLQRTKAEQVAPVFEEFIRRFPEPKSLSIATENEILDVIRSLGLSWRGRFLKLLGTELINGIPGNYNDLLKLSGVGPYAAGAYLSLHAGKWSPLIDSNVIRLYGRYFGFRTDGETRRKKPIKIIASILTPRRAFITFNYALLDFSALICAYKPACAKCPLRRRCSYFIGGEKCHSKV